MPKHLFTFILQTTLRQQVIVSLLSVSVFLLALVPLELQRRIINDVVNTQNIDVLIGLSALYLLVVLVHGGLKYLMNLNRGRISETTIRFIREHIIDGLTADSMEGSSKKTGSEGTLVSVLSAEVEPLGGFIGESISGPILQGGILVSVLGYMFWVAPLLALTAVGLIILELLFVPPIQNLINKKAKKRIETLRDVSDSVVRNTDDAAAMKQETLANIDSIYTLRIQIFRWKFLMKFLVNFLEHLSTLGVISFGGWLVMQGETEIGTIVVFLSGLQRIGGPRRLLISYFRQLTDARIKYDLIRKVPETNAHN